MCVYFDQLFPSTTDVKIIAHRGGGYEGLEIASGMGQRSDLDRMVDKIKTMF